MNTEGPRSLGELAATIGLEPRSADGSPALVDPEITSATIRAQNARDGSLFVALPGARVHGASFAADALAAGAIAIYTDPAGAQIIADGIAPEIPCIVHENPREALGALSSAVYGDPSATIPTVGITGTSGKTTTTYFVEAALNSAGETVGLIGTTGSRVGGQPLVSALTTPEAPEFQDLLATMLERGAESIVAEVSSHALRLGRVDGVHFAVGAFLNLSRDHLDFHPDMEDYFHAKTRLLTAEADPGTRVLPAEQAVVCVDDEWGRRMAELRPDALTVAQTPGAAADWTAGESTPTEDGGQRFTAVRDGREYEVRLALTGRFNVANALVALAIVEKLGLDLDAAVRGLASAHVPGRLEPIAEGQDFRVLVDYAHKPAAVGAVLETVRASTRGRLAVVLGAGGDRDTEKRPLMGAEAVAGADYVVVTDDNPRSEDPAVIRAAVRAGAEDKAAALGTGNSVVIREIGDRAEAIADAIAWARPGDSVVIAGKGHETGQDVAGVVHPFDDRESAREALRSLGGEAGSAEQAGRDEQ
ncbi:UDP-N-acetylmuramoyl-L-alanyl-D-glutamate--2,6-diaminopimelate ligase [Dietzia sp.]|uniref:UDP-N-acetylmuramoyl-L-alanyl-D-glutamate--2, 6-diaminopimelate ligase n=1 Tax=Dietzia sp. TaxID=1871616 RepID=UPI002FDB3879